MDINENMLTYPKNPKPKIRTYSTIPREKTNESLIVIGSRGIPLY